MAPPPPSQTLKTAVLFLKLVTFASLLASVVILTTNTAFLELNTVDFKIHFKDVYAYRYTLSTIVMGMAYTLVQIAFSIHYIGTGNYITTGDGILTFDFYGDKIVSYILATGAGTTFGVTRDVKSIVEALGDIEDKFFDKAYACGSLILIAFVCTAMLSVYSSYSLPKRI